jgi:hypothetical protein
VVTGQQDDLVADPAAFATRIRGSTFDAVFANTMVTDGGRYQDAPRAGQTGRPTLRVVVPGERAAWRRYTGGVLSREHTAEGGAHGGWRAGGRSNRRKERGGMSTRTGVRKPAVFGREDSLCAVGCGRIAANHFLGAQRAADETAGVADDVAALERATACTGALPLEAFLAGTDADIVIRHTQRLHAAQAIGGGGGRHVMTE